MKKKEKEALWNEFKQSDKFRLLTKLTPYDQQEVVFNAAIDMVIDGKVLLTEEEWENIKKRL